MVNDSFRNPIENNPQATSLKPNKKENPTGMKDVLCHSQRQTHNHGKRTNPLKFSPSINSFRPAFVCPFAARRAQRTMIRHPSSFAYLQYLSRPQKKRLISYFLPTKLLFPGAPNFRQKLKIKFHINFSNLNHIYLSHKQSSPQRCILFIRDTDFICHIKFVEVEAKTKGRYNTIFALSFARSAMAMVEERATFTNSPSFAR